MPLITSMKQHFEVRAIEWGMAGWAVTWGLQSILVPEVFLNPVTTPMLNAVTWMGGEPHAVLGLIVLLVGITRAMALFINGLWRRTPMIRVASSAVSGFVVANIIVAFAQGPPSFGLVTYMWLFLADCFSAYRATKDQILSKGKIIPGVLQRG